jgi:CHAT domain-containing protein
MIFVGGSHIATIAPHQLRKRHNTIFGNNRGSYGLRRLEMSMRQGIYRWGLMLSVNVAIVLPGIAASIVAPVSSDTLSQSQAQQALKAAGKLLKRGDEISLRQAIEQFQVAVRWSQQSHDRALQGKALTGLGYVFNQLGEKQTAATFYQEAIVIWRAVGSRSDEAVTLNNLGQIYSHLGEKQKALDLYEQALPITRAIGNRRGEASTLNNIGSIYTALGELNQAIEFYDQALPIWQSLGDRLGETATLNNLGLIYESLGELQRALAIYQEVLAIRRTIGDRLGEATTLNNIGAVHQALGQPQQALTFYAQALPIRRDIGDRAGEATTLNNMGAAYQDLGDQQTALKFYQQALPIRRAVGDRAGETVTLGHLAERYYSQNQLADALKTINAAVQIIESRRHGLTNDRLKTSYFARVQAYYQLKTDILMTLHQQHPDDFQSRGNQQSYAATALETVDQSRARMLRERLIQANAKINQNVSPALLQQVQTLEQAIDRKEIQLVQQNSQADHPEKLTAVTQEITILYRQLEDLKSKIRQSSPAYANLQYPQPITLAAIQQQLDPDTLILQYSLGKDRSYLWVIGQTTLKSYVLPKSQDISAVAKQLQRELVGLDAVPNSAIQLTQQILAPAANDLGNKRLVIVPDGILHTLPFAALNRPNRPTYQPLLTKHEIIYLPSASTIAILRTTAANKPLGPKTLAILADPIFGKNDPRIRDRMNTTIEQDDRGTRDLALDRLPFTATEAKGILALIPKNESTAAFGFDASYDWITSRRISQYRYVHLATHSFFDNDNPALSSIILSSFDKQGRDRKAFLRFPDLFNLNLPTELVVLSACETGLGNNVPGEGLVGMTRGLMYAGASRVAVSLWKVDDQATSDLMQDFYRNLWQGKKSHAAALREAQLKMWQQGKAPYYWAAFTLQGEWRN